MKNEEILTKAIAKAVINGYRFPFSKIVLYEHDLIFGEYRWVYGVIFSHDFAKAFWGEEETTISNEFSDGGETKDQFMKRFRPNDGITKQKEYEWRDFITEPAWQYYLQQMVLEKNPISYLEKFLAQSQKQVQET